MGTRTEDGCINIPPLTHQVLAEYVGTTREIITFQMNHFRQKGLLRYSRKGIQIYDEPCANTCATRATCPDAPAAPDNRHRERIFNFGEQSAAA